MRFADRSEAGRQRAGRLVGHHDRDVAVVGLPRGGVAVAFEVAAAPQASLDVIVVGKLGVPGDSETATGAVGEHGARVRDQAVVHWARISEAQRLGLVRAPTLLIIGSADEPVVRLNRAATAHLRCPHELVVIPGASHLFEELGALETMAHLGREWFARHLQPRIMMVVRR